MSLAAALDPALRTDEDGVVRVGATRVTLRSVVFAFREVATAEEIALRYSSLDLTDIYASITYYLRNRESVDEMIALENREAEEVGRKIEAQFSAVELRERLKARAASR